VVKRVNFNMMCKVLVLKKVIRNQTVFLERQLPGGGEIVVKKDDRVEPFTVVGKSVTSLNKVEFNLADLWGVRFPQSVNKLNIKRDFSSGEAVITYNNLFGLFKKELLAPFRGSINCFDRGTGRLSLVSAPEPIKVLSGLGGCVYDVLPNKALLIKTCADLVAGVWSFGDDAAGELVLFDDVSQFSLYKGSLKDKLLAIKSGVRRESLDKLASLKVGGLITGSLFSRDLRDLSLPVLLTEGCGEIPMSPVIWDFLKSVEIRHCYLSPAGNFLAVPMIDGGVSSCVRPVDFDQKAELKEGNRVKIFSWSNFGAEGVVSKIFVESVTLGSGLCSPAAEVLLDGKNETILVSSNNLGIILG